MAKVSGPLFSLEASGSYGGALTFGKWKGRQYCRQLVIPSNPNTADQEAARNRLRVGGAIQKWIKSSTLIETGQTLTDLDRIKGVTPSGYAWNGFLVDNLIGGGGLNYDAGVAAWTALQAAEKTAWSTAAEALTPAYADVYQSAAGGVPGTPMESGEVFFLHRYAMHKMGVLTAAPGATPPTYA